jgi:hypothetical protein
MEIKTSADWLVVERELQAQIKTVNYNPDLHKMKRNLDTMVRELNQAEVEARRTNGYKYLSNRITEINQAINQLEKWIFILLLAQ